MNVSKNIMDEVQKISKQDKFDYFFQNMKKETQEEEKELFEIINKLFIDEFNIADKDEEKLKLMMKMIYWSRK